MTMQRSWESKPTSHLTQPAPERQPAPVGIPHANHSRQPGAGGPQQTQYSQQRVPAQRPVPPQPPAHHPPQQQPARNPAPQQPQGPGPNHFEQQQPVMPSQWGPGPGVSGRGVLGGEHPAPPQHNGQEYGGYYDQRGPVPSQPVNPGGLPPQQERSTADSPADLSHLKKGQRRAIAQAQARERRWQRNRYSVPYFTDGPKVTFGLLWFAAVISLVLTRPALLVLVVGAAAGLAGLQTMFAWQKGNTTAAILAGFAGALPVLGGVLGPFGVLLTALVAAAVVALMPVVAPSNRMNSTDMILLGIRSALPVGIAGGSIVALGQLGVGAALSLLLMVSAYEAADFLVGSGANNAFEGPITGVVALAAVVFVLWTVSPSPFLPATVILFGALAAVAAPFGQIAASAILPHGTAWAPALRRLDSYLIAAPLWLLLLSQAPVTTAV